MIPTTHIELRHDDCGTARTISRGRALAGYLDGNREYDPSFLDATWDEAAEALHIERDRVAQADAQSRTAEEFNDCIDGDLEDWQMIALQGLDAGVASTVLGLSAMGCVTTTSCRGHPGYAPAYRDFPRVRFYADIHTAALVRGLAVATGCGFGVGEDGVCEVWSDRVDHMLAFAETLIKAGSRHIK